jgi:hypothetical protein
MNNRDDLFWSGVALCLLPWVIIAAILYRARDRKRGGW